MAEILSFFSVVNVKIFRFGRVKSLYIPLGTLMFTVVSVTALNWRKSLVRKSWLWSIVINQTWQCRRSLVNHDQSWVVDL